MPGLLTMLLVETALTLVEVTFCDRAVTDTGAHCVQGRKVVRTDAVCAVEAGRCCSASSDTESGDVSGLDEASTAAGICDALCGATEATPAVVGVATACNTPTGMTSTVMVCAATEVLLLQLPYCFASVCTRAHASSRAVTTALSVYGVGTGVAT